MKTNYNPKYRVNWIDGMKINKSHFEAMEESLLQIVANSEKKSLTPINFGLLPDTAQEGTVMDLSLSLDGADSVTIILNRCRAITLGGYQIEITKETSQILEQSGSILKHQYTIDKDETEWYVILSVNPYARIPVGNADPEEEPPRHPYVFAEYKLDVIPKNESSKQEIGLYHITIGKIILEDGKSKLEEDFIPPCRSIQSHADLKFTYVEIGSFLNQMEAYSMNIIQKIYQKKQANDLAHMVLHLSQQVLYYLNSSITEFRVKDKYEPPIAMISKLMNLARVIKGSLDVYVGTGKEELLNYLSDWCDLNQGAFENVMIEMIELEYVHTDINASLYKVSSFTRLMLSLFKQLNDLDYIGKKQGSNIFVKEKTVEETEIKSRRSFLLD